MSKTSIFGGKQGWKTIGEPFANREAPAVFRDNLDPSKFHLWADKMGPNGFAGLTAWETTDLDLGHWNVSTINVKDFRHGCVTPLTQKQYE